MFRQDAGGTLASQHMSSTLMTMISLGWMSQAVVWAHGIIRWETTAALRRKRLNWQKRQPRAALNQYYAAYNRSRKQWGIMRENPPHCQVLNSSIRTHWQCPYSSPNPARKILITRERRKSWRTISARNTYMQRSSKLRTDTNSAVKMPLWQQLAAKKITRMSWAPKI